MTGQDVQRSLPWLLLVLLAAACRSNPAIPFQEDHWQFFVAGGTGAVKDDFVEHRDHLEFQIVVPRENTAGWAHEIGLRFSGGEGAGLRALDHSGTVTRSERELDWRELSIGARQTFHQGHTFEPYVGAGLAVFRTDSHETFDNGGTEQHDGDHWNDAGVYLRGGILWNMLRDVFAEETEAKLGLEMRGLYATDYSALEFGLVLGLGR